MQSNKPVINGEALIKVLDLDLNNPNRDLLYDFQLGETYNDESSIRRLGTSGLNENVWHKINNDAKACILLIKPREIEVGVKIVEIIIKNLNINNTLDFSSLSFSHYKYLNVSITYTHLEILDIKGIAPIAALNLDVESCSIKFLKASNITISRLNSTNVDIGNWAFSEINFTKELVVQNSRVYHALCFENSTLHFPNSVPRYLIDNCITDMHAKIIFNNIKLNNCGIFQIKDLKGFDRIAFKNINFEMNASISLNDCDLSGLETDCSGLNQFKLVSCINFPYSHADKFRKYHTFRINGFDENPKWGESKKLIYKAHRNLYLKLRDEAKKQNDKQLEDDFYYSQMYWELKNEIRLVPFLYDLLCCFGTSWGRPLLWFLIIGIIFGFLYVLLAMFNKLTVGQSCPSFPAQVALTASFPFGSLASGINLTFIALFLFYSQKVIQSFLLFEIGSAIRNKVKK